MALSPCQFVKTRGGVSTFIQAAFGRHEMNRQVTALICVFLSACAHQPTETELVCSEKLVGVTQIADEQTVREKYGCHKNALPFLVIERHELFPPTPQAGQEFKHCFIYVVCASDPPTPTPSKPF
jgi:hypothetical protein